MRYIPLWKHCTTAHHHAFLLSLNLLPDAAWPEKKQLACLYAISNQPERHYRTATIQKRDGTPRALLIPDPLLMIIQRNILRNVLAGFRPAPAATAYREGASILQNAAPHAGQKQILKLDIEDFFGSIDFAMVYRHAFPRAYFPPQTAALLTALCTHNGYLPQGAPTSAAISNLVLRDFDLHMADWCKAHGIRYTRYCDDMTFSGDFSAKAVESKARGYLGKLGFSLNERKTRLLRGGTRQIVTGIVVNERPQASRAYRDSVRQEIYYCEKFGVASHLNRKYGSSALTETAYLQSLLGKVNFILQANPQDRAFQTARDAVRALLQNTAQQKTDA